MFRPFEGCSASVSDEGLFTYPPMVVCGEARFAGDQRETVIKPDHDSRNALEFHGEHMLVSPSEPRVEKFFSVCQWPGWIPFGDLLFFRDFDGDGGLL